MIAAAWTPLGGVSFEGGGFRILIMMISMTISSAYGVGTSLDALVALL